MTVVGIPQSTTVHISVVRECDVSRARQAAAAIAKGEGFSVTSIYKLATAVSELGNNLVFHADDGGSITVSRISALGHCGVEVVAEDYGPGIADLQAAMTDGYSTNGGLGSGLPGCQRLMDDFEITSVLGIGTRVVVRLWL